MCCVCFVQYAVKVHQAESLGLMQDAEELAAKRRKLLGSDGEGDRRAIAQQKQPKPPPPRN